LTDTFQVVLNTCPTQESAERIARCVVEARLAACVNVVPGLRSYFEWKGKTAVSDEVLLVIKSRPELFDALLSMITSQHPYELPEVIAVPISTGFPPYLAWLTANMRTTP
jgi:periplasmic divalent cation tolerance protein